MFVYKWKVSDIIKGTALVKQIGNCTVTDDEGKLWLVKVLSQSLFTQSVGIITSKLNLLFWNALQNVVFKLHSDGLPDLSLNLNKLHFSSLCKVSLRADEIKLWLTPSAKQRQNPCSGLPAVYPDLSTCHDWPVKKGLCFVCRDRQSGWRGIRNALPVIRWVRWGSRTRISALLSQTVLIRV